MSSTRFRQAILSRQALIAATLKQCQQSPYYAYHDDIASRLNQLRWHGEIEKWLGLIAELPVIHRDHDSFILNQDVIKIGREGQLTAAAQTQLDHILHQLLPWRKGPFDLFGTFIDSEWRSNQKWQRLASAIAPLAGRQILDMGCGNGYYAWRMLGEGAKFILAVDPTQLYWLQFLALDHYINTDKILFLPLKSDDFTNESALFDSVFSMGVLYHCRSPIDHLISLKQALRTGGELVLETLIVEDQDLLTPKHRYAKMRNVWFLPSIELLTIWLTRVGFDQIRVIDICKTTTNEQRQTRWMPFQSLADFLDANDPHKTIEGYPGPIRATLLATRPEN